MLTAKLSEGLAVLTEWQDFKNITNQINNFPDKSH